MTEDHESFNYFNATIKEEIELPDINLDENGEVEISIIKIESFEVNDYTAEESPQSGLRVEDPSESTGDQSPCFITLHHDTDFKDISPNVIQKNNKRQKKERQSKVPNSQDENCISESHKCDKCQKIFTRKDRLRVHSRIHLGEKPHKCNECHKSFLEISNLKRHLRIHSGEKPYKCNDCQKSFSLKCNLLIHSRIHSGDRPYKCKECQKKFPHISDLKKHLRTHSNEKPFQCEVCDKSFRQRYHLNVHSCKRNQTNKKKIEKPLA